MAAPDVKVELTALLAAIKKWHEDNASRRKLMEQVHLAKRGKAEKQQAINSVELLLADLRDFQRKRQVVIPKMEGVTDKPTLDILAEINEEIRMAQNEINSTNLIPIGGRRQSITPEELTDFKKLQEQRDKITEEVNAFDGKNEKSYLDLKQKIKEFTDMLDGKILHEVSRKSKREDQLISLRENLQFVTKAENRLDIKRLEEIQQEIRNEVDKLSSPSTSQLEDLKRKIKNLSDDIKGKIQGAKDKKRDQTFQDELARVQKKLKKSEQLYYKHTIEKDTPIIRRLKKFEEIMASDKLEGYSKQKMIKLLDKFADFSDKVSIKTGKFQDKSKTKSLEGHAKDIVNLIVDRRESVELSDVEQRIKTIQGNLEQVAKKKGLKKEGFDNVFDFFASQARNVTDKDKVQVIELIQRRNQLKKIREKRKAKSKKTAEATTVKATAIAVAEEAVNTAKEGVATGLEVATELGTSVLSGVTKTIFSVLTFPVTIIPKTLNLAFNGLRKLDNPDSGWFGRALGKLGQWGFSITPNMDRLFFDSGPWGKGAAVLAFVVGTAVWLGIIFGTLGLGAITLGLALGAGGTIPLYSSIRDTWIKFKERITGEQNADDKVLLRNFKKNNSELYEELEKLADEDSANQVELEKEIELKNDPDLNALDEDARLEDSKEILEAPATVSAEATLSSDTRRTPNQITPLHEVQESRQESRDKAKDGKSAELEIERDLKEQERRPNTDASI